MARFDIQTILLSPANKFIQLDYILRSGGDFLPLIFHFWLVFALQILKSIICGRHYGPIIT